MKEYLTMKEASLLIGKTPKTIKNYIKGGVIKNFFLVEGKYGQEYKISVRDLEPLGMANIEVLKSDYVRERKRSKPEPVPQEKAGSESPGNGDISPETAGSNGQPASVFLRYEEVLMDLGRCKEKLEQVSEENKKLKQEIEEKNMLIQVLMKKSGA